ncbi:MAG TPA: MFS transporter [Opitutaceae bacterium]|nr:MFS transporter [Opitutaceae bacterium]
MYLATILLCLLAVVGVYFWNNPLHHGGWFLVRRFINWFPLGMSYAFLYMARYNINVSKNALGNMISNEAFGIIFAAGTLVYGFSFLVNGPLVDRLGGKAGILIATVGAAVANVALGLLTWAVLTNRVHVNLIWAFSLLYALNMYFQSYGAVSIIKVKAYWFHVRERGVFGAIFGTLISVGIYFAFDWGQAIADQARPTASNSNWLHRLIEGVFGMETTGIDAVWAVFFIPAALLIVLAALDLWLIKDTPEEAGFASFDTHDASSGKMHVELTKGDLLRMVFTSPLMWMIAIAEFTSGIFRNGITQWYFIFAHQVKQIGAEFYFDHWGWLLCVTGIVGGFAAGLVSDKLFQSRRGPPVAYLCAIILVAALVMAAVLYSSPVVVGAMGVLIVMCAVGITSLMSGTAATDFGGRKATATCSGIVDGFAYLGSGLQSVCLGYITTWNWHWWPLFLAPFAVVGLFIALRIWNELPAATRRYIAEVECGETSVSPIAVGK